MDFAFIVLAVALVISAGIVAFALRRPAAPEPDRRLDDVIRGQGNIAGQFQQTLNAQAQLQTMLAERIEALDKRLGESLTDSATKTAATISSIGERLTVIDEAQKNIVALSGQMVSLQDILSNKQSRGAYGQGQMEAIVRDALPVGLYEFQYTLSNKSRPDCIVRLPGSKTVIVIDSKFPLEGFKALKASANDDERKVATARVRSDVLKHVKDIAEKYLIEGETQTPAIMFVPSESIYAELHDGFAEVIQKAQQEQVIVVSPNILMLAMNTVLSVMKDAHFREKAGEIRKEVGLLMNDVRLLSDRATKLQTHFGQADTDIRSILISTGKIVSRGEKMTTAVTGEPDSNPPQLPPA